MIQKVTLISIINLFSLTFLFGKYNPEVSFKQANRYFVKNTFKTNDLKNNKILSKKKFDEIFGMATIMGEGGIPTSIDFKKYFVIAIINSATNVSTELIPEKLKKKGEGILSFEFLTKIGEQQSMLTVPCLIIIVNRKYKDYKLQLGFRSQSESNQN